jgi:hypothetical protein
MGRLAGMGGLASAGGMLGAQFAAAEQFAFILARAGWAGGPCWPWLGFG